MGEATVSLPGGCAIGNRPIDLHLKALEAAGRRSSRVSAGYVKASAPDGGLQAAGTITFPVVSVGATENALMAASPGVGRNGDRQCRARARDRRSVPLPRRDGRRDRGHRHRAAGRAMGSPACMARTYRGDARSHRSGQLCLRRGDHRRRAGTGSARDADDDDRDPFDGLREAGLEVA